MNLSDITILIIPLLVTYTFLTEIYMINIFNI